MCQSRRNQGEARAPETQKIERAFGDGLLQFDIPTQSGNVEEEWGALLFLTLADVASDFLMNRGQNKA